MRVSKYMTQRLLKSTKKSLIKKSTEEHTTFRNVQGKVEAFNLNSTDMMKL